VIGLLLPGILIAGEVQPAPAPDPVVPPPVELNRTARQTLDFYQRERGRFDERFRIALEEWRQATLRARVAAIAALKRSLRPGDSVQQRAAVLREVLGLDLADVDARTFFEEQGQFDAVLAEVAARASPTDILGNPMPPAGLDAGNVALAVKGATVAGEGIGNPQHLLDGVSTGYDGSSGYTDGNCPCAWTIDLGKPQPLKLVRFLLWDGDPRFYRYRLEASDDGQRWGVVKDAAEGEHRGWQSVELKGRPLRYLRIHGLFNSANSSFHLVEFEAYNIRPE
jgi:hypothetical protein